MVNLLDDPLAITFAALADPTRRAILERLTKGDASVTELARPFAVSLPAISKQLRVLERAGLLTQEKQGRVRRCHLEAEPLREAVEWLERYRRYWEQQLDSLTDYLNELKNEEEQP
ncbi:MAG: metalloregulator ArsR/SmtB family transcription factor [Chloroflexi bacterium]|nr:metalloregulator ArsR/SmtB family transcription factor [Chloroflexota bacterium]MDA1219738.1 metalloregulator ArsR/SmtB family transcription factor [Chloroflexota bacterium]PKB57354.1 MAG: transcriptional regulator [SAR202 cluster bacterium Casp-Chloro-G3]